MRDELLRMIRTIWRELERQNQSKNLDPLYLYNEQLGPDGIIKSVGVDNTLDIEQLAEAILAERR